MQIKTNCPVTEQKEENTGDCIKGSKAELIDCVMHLSFINDNLHCVRFGIEEEVIPNSKMIKNALYYINLGLEELIGKMDKLI